jgi:hypothetical protein
VNHQDRPCAHVATPEPFRPAGWGRVGGDRLSDRGLAVVPVPTSCRLGEQATGPRATWAAMAGRPNGIWRLMGRPGGGAGGAQSVFVLGADLSLISSTAQLQRPASCLQADAGAGRCRDENPPIPMLPPPAGRYNTPSGRTNSAAEVQSHILDLCIWQCQDVRIQFLVRF